jgi:hypothetical protein
MVSVIAAVHPFVEFKMLLRSVVCSGRIYSSLRSFQSGQTRRICRTVIAPVLLLLYIVIFYFAAFQKVRS